MKGFMKVTYFDFGGYARTRQLARLAAFDLWDAKDDIDPAT